MDDKKGQPRVWRRFRVSAGIEISAFQDKAVAPIMGMVSQPSHPRMPIFKYVSG